MSSCTLVFLQKTCTSDSFSPHFSGYGNTTPQTSLGKVLAVFYGFVGCSGNNDYSQLSQTNIIIFDEVQFNFFHDTGGILFFNLFLERIITFLAWILRNAHARHLRRRIRKNSVTDAGKRRSFRSSTEEKTTLPDILDDDDGSLNMQEWKPSVYLVMLFLSVVCCIIACCAAALYAPLESWKYLDALYFCFISFTTIGFGDFVSTEKSHYPYVHWYVPVESLTVVYVAMLVHRHFLLVQVSYR